MTDPAPLYAEIVGETPADAAAIDALVTGAFGPGRFAKTAERLREQARLAVGLVARDGARLAGSVRLWAIRVGAAEALFLGPIAVARDRRSEGLGARLVTAAVEAARERGVAGVLLVGDPAYFERFGFGRAEGVELPGPVDPKRLLWVGFEGTAPSGMAEGGMATGGMETGAA